jgi:hypothetical protein
MTSRLVLIGLIGLAAGPAAAQDNPASAYRVVCARCHDDAARLARQAMERFGADDFETRLSAFLARHYAFDPAQRDLIVAHIAAQRR